MELALNLVWLALAISGVLLLARELFRAPLHAARHPSRRQKILAMTCTLIILFFVVSMTDDLHDQEIFVEECKSLRVMSGNASPALAAARSTVAPHFVLFLGFTRSSFDFALPAVWRLLEPLEVSFAAVIDCDLLSGRAPPAPLA